MGWTLARGGEPDYNRVVSQDYILRLLQQLGAVVATILGRRAAGDLAGAEQEIEEQCLRHVGLPWVIVRQSSPESLRSLLAMGGALQSLRTLVVAELLVQSADLAQARCNPPAAAADLSLAEALYREILPQLGGSDAEEICRRHRDVVARQRDLGDVSR